MTRINDIYEYDVPLSEEYRIAAHKWVDLDNAANLLEKSQSAFLATLMATAEAPSVAKAEMSVKSGEEWKAYIQKMVHARYQASKAKIDLEVVRMRFQEVQSAEANKRAEMRL